MRRRSRRRHLRQSRAVPGIRRYLLCLRNDTSDTDSDSIPLSSFLDDTNDTDIGDYSASLLSQLNNNVGNVNPAVCSGLMQVMQCACLTACHIVFHSSCISCGCHTKQNMLLFEVEGVNNTETLERYGG